MKATGIIPLAKCVAFLCFILSGAASISYETIWLRQAMTYFGVINPVISSVLSVFMAGLAAGTWIAGRLTSRLSSAQAAGYYALIELLVAAYALVLPMLFKAGYGMLLSLDAQESLAYLAWSQAIIVAVLLPVCTLIGCTFPMLMHFLRGFRQDNSNFGFLYYANLLGGVLGCILPLAAIEMYGFSGALYITIAFNLAAFLLALFVSRRAAPADAMPVPQAAAPQSAAAVPESGSAASSGFLLFTLFLFGLATMGSEVIWMRAYMPAVGPTVYSFALILGLYLIFTAVGTGYYLSESKRGFNPGTIMMLLPACALLPVIGSDSITLRILSIGAAAIGAVSFCLGFLTPSIIDKIAANDARKASVAYLYNFAGCILGPLLSTYMLFFWLGIKLTMIFYACLLFLVAVISLRRSLVRLILSIALFAATMPYALHSKNAEDYIQLLGKLERDNIGYIGGTGKGMQKFLTVNGIGMTALTTLTKVMADLPVLHHPNPKSALVICFGMGTTTRAFTAWPLEDISVAELSRGVTKLFDYFHADAARVLSDPRVHISVDDGRRFLNRTQKKFDIITIDPPPPVTSSGSGLLYTEEFLTVLKKRLAPGGILAHWIFTKPLPEVGSDPVFANAAINAIRKTFKYVKLFDAFTPGLGVQVLASDSPLPDVDVSKFVSNLTPKAAEDLKEWEGKSTLEALAAAALQPIDETKMLLPQYKDLYMADDRLYNEFYLLRHFGWYNPASR